MAQSFIALYMSFFICHFCGIYHIMSSMISICVYFSLCFPHPCHMILSSLRAGHGIPHGTRHNIQHTAGDLCLPK